MKKMDEFDKGMIAGAIIASFMINVGFFLARML